MSGNTRKIRFTLRGDETELALAFERWCNKELGIIAPLDELVHRQFIRFLQDSVDKSQAPAAAGEQNAVGDTRGDTPAVTVSASGADPAGETQPQAGAYTCPDSD